MQMRLVLFIVAMATRLNHGQIVRPDITFKKPADIVLVAIKENTKVETFIFDFSTALLTGEPIMYYAEVTPADGNLQLTPKAGKLSTVPNADLNYEKTASYTVKISATDGVKVGSVTVTLNLVDINEAPSISNLPATLLYPENFAIDAPPAAKPWRVIYKVNAKDPDNPLLPANAPWKTLSYKMTTVLPKSQSDPPGVDMFDLDPTTGELRMKISPNFEEYNQYRFSIWVEDGGGLKTEVINLNLDISDVNEPPWFNVSSPPYYQMFHQAELYSCEIWEESPIGMQLPIPPITAYDEDASDRLTYQLEGRDHIYFEIKTINGSGYIHVTKRIDFESRDIYLRRGAVFSQSTSFQITLYVSAYDKGMLRTIDTDVPTSVTQGKASRLEVKVQVYDINDHLPECNPTYYTATIKENTPVDTSILTISCSDLDYDKRIAYTVNGSDVANRYFWVSWASSGHGVLRTKGPADIESDVSVLFYVYAYQGLYPKRTSANVTVLIHITAVNDNIPLFNKTFYNFEVPSDAPPGHPVGKLDAYDTDRSEAILSYHWVSTNTLFKMAAHDGIISTLKALENGRKYIYYAHAKDNGSPPKYSEHVPVRIDTFDRKSYVVDFIVAQPRSFFTDKYVQDFLDAVTSACPPCVGRLSGLTATKGSIHSATTLAVHILKDSSSDRYSNVDEPKLLLSKSEILDIFAVNSQGQPSVAVSLPTFHRFPVIKVLRHGESPLTAEEWLLTTPGGKTIIALLSILAIVLFLIALAYLIKFLIPYCKEIKCPKIPNLDCKSLKCDCCERPETPPPIEKHIYHPDGQVKVMDFRYHDAPLVPPSVLKPTTA